MEKLSEDLARELFRDNFIGSSEMERISTEMNILQPSKLSESFPKNNFSFDLLRKFSKSHILILCIPFDSNYTPLTLLKLRNFFGIDPLIKEPCFYNQDWYLQEDFAVKTTCNLGWYLVKKSIQNDSRGLTIQEFNKKIQQPIDHLLPSALLASYTFFAYFLLSQKALWEQEYIWCADKDSNKDRIYVGKYYDPNRINKNGFEIHRHLSIKSYHGIVSSYFQHLSKNDIKY